MDFKIDGEFRFTVTASDGYKYYFWSIYATEINTGFGDNADWQYIISVYKPREDWNSVADL